MPYNTHLWILQGTFEGVIQTPSLMKYPNVFQLGSVLQVGTVGRLQPNGLNVQVFSINHANFVAR